jgi:hypothetical protein
MELDNVRKNRVLTLKSPHWIDHGWMDGWTDGLGTMEKTWDAYCTKRVPLNPTPLRPLPLESPRSFVCLSRDRAPRHRMDDDGGGGGGGGGGVMTGDHLRRPTLYP